MKKNLYTALFLLVCTFAYSQNRQPYQYRDPAKVDLSDTFRAQSNLQYNYNQNTNRVQNTITNISGELYRMSKTDEESKYWNNIFVNKCISKMPNINYSSNSQADQLITFLYDCINYQLKNN